MKIKSEIEELKARLDFLEEKVIRISERNQKPGCEYLWNKFEDLIVFSRDFDKNSEEWRIITKAGWELLDEYLKTILTIPFGKDKE